MSGTQRIAFVDLEGQLATVAPDGSARQQLTQDVRVFQFPAWSPDNRTLAAIGGDAQEAGLFVTTTQVTPGAAYLRRLYTSRERPPVYFAWSPNGTSIGLLAVHPAHRLAIHLLAAEGESDQQAPLLIGGQPCFWHWHADSLGLLAHVDLGRRSAQVAHVRWRPPGQASVQPLAIQPGFFQAPALSHDGRYLAYAQRTPAGTSQLVAAERDGKTVIGEHEGFVALNWSPTRAQLAFLHPLTANQEFYGPLHLWDAASGQVRRLSAATILAFLWSPDGRQIAYFAATNSPSPEQAVPMEVTNGHFNGSWPIQQSEQTQLALTLTVVDVTTGQSRSLAHFAPSAPFVNQFLPFFDQYAKSHSLWSPESNALLLPVEEAGRPLLRIIDTTTGHGRPLTTGVMGVWSW